MTEEEKKAIKYFKALNNLFFEPYLSVLLNLIEKQQKEIEELKKVIKMVEVYKPYGIPEDVEMVIMRKDDLLSNTNNEFISKDKVREKIKKEEKHQETTKKLFPDSLNYHMQKYAVEVLKELLEE